MGKTSQRRFGRHRRKKHIRKVVRGTAERPRMCVFRSARHIYVQVIDDVAGRTIVSASSMSAEMKGHSGGNAAGAREVGRLIGERAKEAGIVRVVFDRNGHLYHGRVAALADAARETGLQF